ncbi:hypothetical protein AA309_27095 [Microvirga vignae]|uniref:Uncharacterized protein n=1 Tax=Microvirga vignae TaxID=1225564 RepID=A0A0H1R517_9HYPH|nr:hypothetical protein [Microvirga vignae]KLK90179.1 hypothetical protein AA309_27095 [Microvirga vignae]
MEKKQDILVSEALAQAIENGIDDLIHFILPGNLVHKNGRIRQERTSTRSVAGSIRREPAVNESPGTPEDVAALDVYLASDGSSYTMSHVRLVDGGLVVDGGLALSNPFSFLNFT